MADQAAAVQHPTPAPRSSRGYRQKRKAGTSISSQQVDVVALADPAPKTSKKAEAAPVQTSAKPPVTESSGQTAPPPDPKSTGTSRPKKSPSRTPQAPSSSSANTQPAASQQIDATGQSEPVSGASRPPARIDELPAAAGSSGVAAAVPTTFDAQQPTPSPRSKRSSRPRRKDTSASTTSQQDERAAPADPTPKAPSEPVAQAPSADPKTNEPAARPKKSTVQTLESPSSSSTNKVRYTLLWGLSSKAFKNVDKFCWAV
ncbi:hypothetical protein HYPSUDRAFT_723673 [Hypholoma sublateritium FD-334 SS-4]|uniref:Uncharacterized protein n=1 Tax=Hypholoma sublateritium (strain FD-334 SS-4) TaxID=945553 RepID=A0A0D2NYF6_HYPSF|nr:hypothetical protein HYPSUDRAFT_723673 [Hypholoma sublateritium FD-334 SS-4]